MPDARDGIPRDRVVEIMRDHWQDPAGFHEALANELGIEESEYAPSVVEQIAEWLGDPVNRADERAGEDLARDIRLEFGARG